MKPRTLIIEYREAPDLTQHCCRNIIYQITKPPAIIKENPDAKNDITVIIPTRMNKRDAESFATALNGCITVKEAKQ